MALKIKIISSHEMLSLFIEMEQGGFISINILRQFASPHLRSRNLNSLAKNAKYRTAPVFFSYANRLFFEVKHLLRGGDNEASTNTA